MSFCSSDLSISPDSSNGEKILLPSSCIAKSPAHATSVPSAHCAVSPGDMSARQDGNKKIAFTSEMTKRAAEDIEKKKFDSLVDWYYANYGKKNPHNPPSTISQSQERNDDFKKNVKRKADSDQLENLETKRNRVASPEAEKYANMRVIKREDDNPLRRMELMTNSSDFDPSGISEVVESPANLGNTINNNQKQKDNPDRSAKLEQLSEIEKQFGMSDHQQQKPEDSEWKRMRQEQEKQNMLNEARLHHGLPCNISALPSPIFPRAAGMNGGPHSAGAYPSPFPQYNYPAQGPASAGAYPGMGGFHRPPHGFPVTSRVHPIMTPQQQQTYMMMANSNRGMLNPASEGFHGPQMPVHPSMTPGSVPNPYPGAFPGGAMPGGMVPNGYPPGVAPPPPYGYTPTPQGMHPAYYAAQMHHHQQQQQMMMLRNGHPGPGMPTNGHPGMPTNGHPGMPTNGHPGMPTNGHPVMPSPTPSPNYGCVPGVGQPLPSMPMHMMQNGMEPMKNVEPSHDLLKGSDPVRAAS